MLRDCLRHVLFEVCWDRVPLFAYAVRITYMILRTVQLDFSVCVIYAEICVNATADPGQQSLRKRCQYDWNCWRPALVVERGDQLGQDLPILVHTSNAFLRTFSRSSRICWWFLARSLPCFRISLVAFSDREMAEAIFRRSQDYCNNCGLNLIKAHSGTS